MWKREYIKLLIVPCDELRPPCEPVVFKKKANFNTITQKLQKQVKFTCKIIREALLKDRLANDAILFYHSYQFTTVNRGPEEIGF